MRKLLSAAIVALAASVANAQFCQVQAVNLPIPDNNPAGVSSTINVQNAFPITGVAVKIDMAHTWVGDLIVTLTGPSGVATIMRRTGSATTGGTGDSSNVDANYTFTDRFGAQNYSLLSGVGNCGIKDDISLQPVGTPSGNWWSEAGIAGGLFNPNTGGATGYIMRSGDYIASSNNFTGTLSTSYVEINLLAALGGQSNGNWTLTISDHAGADLGTFRGWTLQLLPEPASMALLGLGALALIRRRRS